MRFALITVACALLVSCQTSVPQTVADSQKAPTKALKIAIVNAARDVVFDPYSIRDAEISNVVLLNPSAGIDAVCVKANAKNHLVATPVVRLQAYRFETESS